METSGFQVGPELFDVRLADRVNEPTAKPWELVTHPNQVRHPLIMTGSPTRAVMPDPDERPAGPE